MRLPKGLTSITPLSKTLAFILFIALPILGFYLGTKYESISFYNQNYQDLLSYPISKKTEKELPIATVSPTLILFPSPTPMNVWGSYMSKYYRFKFNYPLVYKINEDITGVHLINGNHGFTINLPEKWIIFDSDDRKSFSSYSLRATTVACGANGPTGEMHCNNVIKEETHTNPYGLKVNELYLNRVETIIGKPATNSTVGPFYTIDINNKIDSLLNILFIGPVDNNLITTVKEIIDTLHF